MMLHTGQQNDALALGGWSAVPVGAIVAFAGNLGGANAAGLVRTIEAWGWKECDGRAVATASYPELFAFIGCLYGCPAGGDPPTHFNLPDYRGLFLRAVDGGRGKDPDASERQPAGDGKAAEAGAMQADALRHHQHQALPAGLDTSERVAPNASIQTTITLDGQPAPGISALETRPVNIAVHYLIRVTARPPHLPRRGP
jgi:microcystin-dependent protein